tara:strand:- start:331 stop:690 length:360 start_codon:yes stop_codon:yes gene_type:complete
MKLLLALLPLAVAPAISKPLPFVMVEQNSVYPNGKYNLSTLELQFGVKNEFEKGYVYASAGPIMTHLAVTNDFGDTELAGTVGADIQINGNISMFGEVFGTTSDTFITKTGIVYSFNFY